MNPFFFLVACLVNVSAISAYKLLGRPFQLIIEGCANPVGSFNFGWTIDETNYYQYCDYAPALGSVALCVKQHSENDHMYHQAAKQIVSKSCVELTVDDFYNAYENATKYAANYTELEAANATIYNPVDIPEEIYGAYYHGYHLFYRNYDMSNVYGYIIIAYWFGAMLISAAARFLKRTGLITKLYFGIIQQLQKYILLPNFFKNTHNQQFKTVKVVSALIPTRADGIVVALYLIIHIVVLCVQWEFDYSGYVFTSKKEQVARYLADRTGIIAFAHLPLIYLFAGRNNIMSFVTGFSYSSYIQFHKWTGRIMFADAIIHSACYTALYVWDNYYSEALSEKYIRFGILATVSCAVLMIQAYNYFRQYTYEIFLYGHIIFAIIFTFSVYHHCIELGWMEYVYATIAIWAFDRLLRLVRLINFGFPKATIKIVSEDTMRISMRRPSSKRWHAKPGQFVFAYFMLPKTFWQSHPFTISDSTVKDGEVILYVKRKSGITDTLYQRVARKPGKIETNIRVSIEGPYGESAPNFQYDNTLLFAGGNGIPGPYDHALKLSRKFPDGQKNVHLFWTAKDLQSIHWFAHELSLLKNASAKVTIFLTRENHENLQALRNQTFNKSSDIEQEKTQTKNESDITEKSANKMDEKSILDTDSSTSLNNDAFLNSFDIQLGRPNMEEIIQKSFAENQGSISICACGPSALCDSLRRLIAQNLDIHKGRVDYYEELQVW